MESTYINTGHPDFISGHRAMAIISDRMAAAKPPPAAIDPKTGKLPPGTLNNGRDLDSDLKNKEEGFFGSFWPGGKKPAVKKSGASAMEAVRSRSRRLSMVLADLDLGSLQPPQVLRASGTLSERETMETEVIKLLISSYFSLSKRTLIDMVPKGRPQVFDFALASC